MEVYKGRPLDPGVLPQGRSWCGYGTRLGLLPRRKHLTGLLLSRAYPFEVRLSVSVRDRLAADGIPCFELKFWGLAAPPTVLWVVMMIMEREEKACERHIARWSVMPRGVNLGD